MVIHRASEWPESASGHLRVKRSRLGGACHGDDLGGGTVPAFRADHAVDEVLVVSFGVSFEDLVPFLDIELTVNARGLVASINPVDDGRRIHGGLDPGREDNGLTIAGNVDGRPDYPVERPLFADNLLVFPVLEVSLVCPEVGEVEAADLDEV